MKNIFKIAAIGLLAAACGSAEGPFGEADNESDAIDSWSSPDATIEKGPAHVHGRGNATGGNGGSESGIAGMKPVPTQTAGTGGTSNVDDSVEDTDDDTEGVGGARDVPTTDVEPCRVITEPGTYDIKVCDQFRTKDGFVAKVTDAYPVSGNFWIAVAHESGAPFLPWKANLESKEPQPFLGANVFYSFGLYLVNLGPDANGVFHASLSFDGSNTYENCQKSFGADPFMVRFCSEMAPFTPMGNEKIFGEGSPTAKGDASIAPYVDWKQKMLTRCMDQIHSRFGVEMLQPRYGEVTLYNPDEDLHVLITKGEYILTFVHDAAQANACVESGACKELDLNQLCAGVNAHELTHVFLKGSPLDSVFGSPQKNVYIGDHNELTWLNEGLGDYVAYEINRAYYDGMMSGTQSSLSELGYPLTCGETGFHSTGWYTTDTDGKHTYHPDLNFTIPYADLSLNYRKDATQNDRDYFTNYYHTAFCFWEWLNQEIGEGATESVIRRLGELRYVKGAYNLFSDVIEPATGRDVSVQAQARFGIRPVVGAEIRTYHEPFAE